VSKLDKTQPSQNRSSVIQSDGHPESGEGAGVFMTSNGFKFEMNKDTNSIGISHGNGQANFSIGQEGAVTVYGANSVNFRGAAINIQADADLNIFAGGNVNIRAGQQTTIEAGSNVNITGEDKVNIDGASAVNVKSDGVIATESAADTSIKGGATVNINGGPDVKLNSGGAIAVPKNDKTPQKRQEMATETDYGSVGTMSDDAKSSNSAESGVGKHTPTNSKDKGRQSGSKAHNTGEDGADQYGEGAPSASPEDFKQ
jgi:hypothetical protein